MSARSRRLVLTVRAEQDLEDILVYSRSHHGEHQRGIYAATIEAALERLMRFPDLGRPADTRWTNARRHPVQQHVIYYVVDGPDIRILRILHGRKDVAEELHRKDG